MKIMGLSFFILFMYKKRQWKAVALTLEYEMDIVFLLMFFLL